MSKPVKPKSKAEFAKLYDKKKILHTAFAQGIKDLGPEGWEYEREFARSLGFSPQEFAATAPSFPGLCLEVGRQRGRQHRKRVWCGSTKLAKELQEIL